MRLVFVKVAREGHNVEDKADRLIAETSHHLEDVMDHLPSTWC